MQVQIEVKNCSVTGANSGFGYATAEGLASRGATVYIVCRNKERGEAALSKIQSANGNKNVHLESHRYVIFLASSMSSRLLRGFLELYRKDFRLIILDYHSIVIVQQQGFDGVEQYARNKRVQVALTERWADAYKDKGVGFYSMHPDKGARVNTCWRAKIGKVCRIFEIGPKLDFLTI